MEKSIKNLLDILSILGGIPFGFLAFALFLFSLSTANSYFDVTDLILVFSLFTFLSSVVAFVLNVLSLFLESYKIKFISSISYLIGIISLFVLTDLYYNNILLAPFVLFLLTFISALLTRKIKLSYSE